MLPRLLQVHDHAYVELEHLWYHLVLFNQARARALRAHYFALDEV